MLYVKLLYGLQNPSPKPWTKTVCALESSRVITFEEVNGGTFIHLFFFYFNSGLLSLAKGYRTAAL
jgi:hypothetical protein